MSNPKVQSTDMIDALHQLGYDFRLNLCSHMIEVSGKPISDYTRAQIRVKMRDKGFQHPPAFEDVYLSEAARNAYHPVREYLMDCWVKHDGHDHITDVANCVGDPTGNFQTFFKRWLIGAVAKAFDPRNHQNFMLVLEGKQDIGKSLFTMWLCSGIPKYHIEAPIDPDDKDCLLRLASKFIWEVGELGSTTRRHDRESLKMFITLPEITVRKPYGRDDLILPALASLIGTVNDEYGILSDKTGNRRFVITHVESFDWHAYTKLHVGQMWGQAMCLYKGGESPKLTPTERQQANELNDAYEIEDPVENMLIRYFFIDPSDLNSWMSTGEIREIIESLGLKRPDRSTEMSISGTLKKMGCLRDRRLIKGKQLWGYWGVRYELGSGRQP